MDIQKYKTFLLHVYIPILKYARLSIPYFSALKKHHLYDHDEHGPAIKKNFK